MAKKRKKKPAKRKRKVRFSREMWETDFPGTLARWLHWYLPRHLTKLWRQYPPRGRCKDLAEKNGCAACGEQFERHEMEVDHIIPKGPVPRELSGWGEYLARYFCAPENLQSLCVGCHKAKTKRERAA